MVQSVMWCGVCKSLRLGVRHIGIRTTHQVFTDCLKKVVVAFGLQANEAEAILFQCLEIFAMVRGMARLLVPIHKKHSLECGVYVER